MRQSFDHEPVSPIDGEPPTERPKTASSSSYFGGQNRTLSSKASASSIATAPDLEKTPWDAPPVPPIPADKEVEQWRARSRKRMSYVSHMSNYSVPRASTSDGKAHAHVSTISISHSGKSMPTAPLSHPNRLHGQSGDEDLDWQIAPYNPRQWSRRKKWLHSLAAGESCRLLTEFGEY